MRMLPAKEMRLVRDTQDKLKVVVGMQIDEKPEAKVDAAKLLAERRASNADASPSGGTDTNGLAARPMSAAGKPEPITEAADITTSTAAAESFEGECSSLRWLHCRSVKLFLSGVQDFLCLCACLKCQKLERGGNLLRRSREGRERSGGGQPSCGAETAAGAGRERGGR